MNLFLITTQRMTYQNAQLKNTGNDEGDVLKFFQSKLRNLIAHNGGDHTFGWFTEDVDDKDAPMPIGTKTKIKWTHQGHTISQMEKNFVTAKLNLVVQLNKTLNLEGDTANLNRIFIGFKHAVELFSDARLWIDNVMLKEYQQDELIRESFAYNSIKPIDAKEPAKHRYSLWENTSRMSPSVCGVYVPLTLLADGNAHRITFEASIYFTDQLAFQAWQLYPNSICGEIEEEIKSSTEALVWHQVQPSVVKEIEELLNCSIIEQDVPANMTISNKFSQIGSPSTIVTEYKLSDAPQDGSNDLLNEGYQTLPVLGDSSKVIAYKTEEVILNCRGGTIVTMKSDLAGFGVKPDCLNGLIRELNTPLLIPSQQLVREGFQGLATDAGLDVSKSIALSNATNITVMFPKRTNEITCFDNIMYQNVQLTINNVKYPDTEFDSTIGPRFYQYQLISNELDGSLRPSHELEDSWTMSLNAPDGTRYKNTISDATSFCINFQLERTNSGYVFDGVDTGGNTVTIKFKGQPLYRGANDTYYNYDASNPNVHPPAPEMWVCTDTYFTWQRGAVKYYANGVPDGYY